jgi:predicted neuraminidase
MRIVVAIFFMGVVMAAGAQTPEDKKASEWVGALKLGDDAKEARVEAVVAQHLRAVKMYNDEHVPMPKSAHDSLMNGLRKDLADSQVNKILDKYTVGKVDFTLRGYKAIVPDLTPQEEAVIRKNLEQAREEAMDVKNMKQISAVFEIYKTKNEQYLDSNGRNWHELFGAYVRQVKRKKIVVAEEFLYDTAGFPECHAATIAETPGGLVAAYFGGTKERNPDVCIYVSRKAQGAKVWTAPVNVANGVQGNGVRYACWNPVLYQIPAGDLLLYYKIGPSPAKWKGWLIRSKDGGASWSKPVALPEGFLGPIKNQPVALSNGTLICPTSVEGDGWKIHFELSPDGGKTYKMGGAVPAAADLKAIQPTILLHKDGTIQALSRSQNRAILSTESKDGGLSWSTLEATALPNNNSGIDGVTLADGRQLLVYNHVLPPAGETKGERSPLNVAVSPDGKDWYAALVLEDDHAGQYSYPSVIQSKDGMVHIVYTYHRKKIRYVELDPSKLELKKIENGVWPETVKK